MGACTALARWGGGREWGTCMPFPPAASRKVGILLHKSMICKWCPSPPFSPATSPIVLVYLLTIRGLSSPHHFPVSGTGRRLGRRAVSLLPPLPGERLRASTMDRDGSRPPRVLPAEPWPLTDGHLWDPVAAQPGAPRSRSHPCVEVGPHSVTVVFSSFPK